MSQVIGQRVDKSGRPWINGKPALLDENEPLLDCFSRWLCPECDANLSADTLICLNACHLSAAADRRFRQALGEASLRGRP